MSAVIFQLGGVGDKALILDTRQAFIYPFNSPNWLDLRFGYWLSLTKSTNNDDPTGLGETLITVGTPPDRVWIGIKDNSIAMPRSAGTTFMGHSNTANAAADNAFSSQVVSTLANGGAGTDYWRHANASNAAFQGILLNANSVQGSWGSPPYLMLLPQNVAGIGGFAALIVMRFTRPSVGGAIQMANYYTTTGGSHSTFLYTNTPTIGSIRSAFLSPPAIALQAASSFTVTPNALYFYWPFYNSKLRIHAVCLEKFA